MITAPGCILPTVRFIVYFVSFPFILSQLLVFISPFKAIVVLDILPLSCCQSNVRSAVVNSASLTRFVVCGNKSGGIAPGSRAACKHSDSDCTSSTIFSVILQCYFIFLYGKMGAVWQHSFADSFASAKLCHRLSQND